MHKLLFVTVGSAIAAIAVAGIASGKIVQTFAVSAPPAKAGKPIAFNVDETTSDDDPAVPQPSPLKEQIIRVNKGGQFNGKYFPRCKKTKLLASGSCPKPTQIGNGTATAEAKPIVPLVSATLKIYNGEKQNGHDTVYVYAIPTIGPQLLTIGEVFKQPTGAFDYTLDFHIDDIQTLPGAPNASVTAVHTKTPIKKAPASASRASASGKKKKAKYLIVAPQKCTGTWVGEGEFHYANGQVIKMPGQIPCHK